MLLPGHVQSQSLACLCLSPMLTSEPLGSPAAFPTKVGLLPVPCFLDLEENVRRGRNRVLGLQPHSHSQTHAQGVGQLSPCLLGNFRGSLSSAFGQPLDEGLTALHLLPSSGTTPYSPARALPLFSAVPAPSLLSPISRISQGQGLLCWTRGDGPALHLDHPLPTFQEPHLSGVACCLWGIYCRMGEQDTCVHR